MISLQTHGTSEDRKTDEFPLSEKVSLSVKLSSFEHTGLLLVLAILAIILAIKTPVFISQRNILNLFRQISMNMIAGVGMTVLMISGEVDLSIGSLQAFVGVVVMDVLNTSQNLLLGILVGIGIGILVGILNGLVVVKLKVNSLIATLAMMMILRGAAYAYTQGAIQNYHNIPGFSAIGNGYLGFLPWPIFIMLVISFFFYLVLHHTTLGRKIHAVGGNPRATLVTGINVIMIKFVSFIICSVLSSISAIILLSRMNSGQNNAGMGFELTVIAAVLLGGGSLNGGQGSLFGTFLGTLLLGTIANGIVLLRMNYNWQVVLTGLIILIAMCVAQYRKRIYEEG